MLERCYKEHIINSVACKGRHKGRPETKKVLVDRTRYNTRQRLDTGATPYVWYDPTEGNNGIITNPIEKDEYSFSPGSV